jgi:hypothetical protein
MPDSGSLDLKRGTPIAVLFVLTNHFRSPKMIKFESTRLSRVKNHVESLTQGKHQSSEAALAGPVTVQDVLKCTVLVVACQSPRNLATGRKGAGLPLPSKVRTSPLYCRPPSRPGCFPSPPVTVPGPRAPAQACASELELSLLNRPGPLCTGRWRPAGPPGGTWRDRLLKADSRGAGAVPRQWQWQWWHFRVID